MRAALIALTVLLLPAALFAEGTIGVYFGAGNGVYYSPAQYEEFSGYVLISGLDCYISAAEFMVQVPTGIQITGFSIPDGSVSGAVVAVCWPDYDKRFPTGLTSIICPTQIGVESKSWGSIKSLYDK
jgi:hypothetical protein